MLTTSTVIYQGARFAFSLAAARALEPADFTSWVLVISVLVYAPSLLLGVSNGLSRELPILIASGRSSDADRGIAATWFATLAAVAAVLLAALMVVLLAPSAASLGVAMALLVPATIVVGIQQFILRSTLRFGAAAAQQALFGVLMAVSTLILWVGIADDLVGAALLYAAPTVIAMGAGMFGTAPRQWGGWTTQDLTRLASIGFPIMVAGLVFSIFVTLDRWMAITLLGLVDAAPYALASLIATAMLVIPGVVSQQTYPRMAMALGHGAGRAELLSMARRQGLVAAAVVAPIALGLVLFSVMAIPILLPDYEAARAAVVILSIGYVLLALLTGYGNYLNVMGGQWRYLAAQLAAATVSVLLMVVGGSLLGITGIALGMAGSHLVYGLLLSRTAYRYDPTGGAAPSAGGE